MWSSLLVKAINGITMNNKYTTDEERKYVLPIYDVQAIEDRLTPRSLLSGGLFNLIVRINPITVLLRPLLNPFANKNQKIIHICVSDQTAHEIANCLARISDVNLRKKLRAEILPFIESKSNEDMQKLFQIDFNFDELNDDKGDLYLSQQTYHDSSSQRQIHIYYAKCLICRENDRYHINLAYYDYTAILPTYNISFYFRDREDVDKDLQVARALAYNAIHKRLKYAWPERITLQRKLYLPDLE
ncbi:unnamed protein product [Adineta steineri]|uniref:Uncharacterized protein n=1 Tax=Adineta steineri TaxID=433720 RepID=A0A815M861_9BILA|nr:unnamed protein product [Adineta steineri]CAF3962528.1 unnamed protein product [Adineta steineri]